MEWPYVADEAYCSTASYLLAVLQTFVIVQVAYFIFTGCQ